jgi:hypothetical protein
MPDRRAPIEEPMPRAREAGAEIVVEAGNGDTPARSPVPEAAPRASWTDEGVPNRTSRRDPVRPNHDQTAEEGTQTMKPTTTNHSRRTA